MLGRPLTIAFDGLRCKPVSRCTARSLVLALNTAVTLEFAYYPISCQPYLPPVKRAKRGLNFLPGSIFYLW